MLFPLLNVAVTPQEHQALCQPHPCVPQLCERTGVVEGRGALRVSQRSPRASPPVSLLWESPKGPHREQARVPSRDNAVALTSGESQHQVFSVQFREIKAHSPSSCSVSQASSVAGAIGYT